MPRMRAKKKNAEVVAIPGAERPEDVIKFVLEAIALGGVAGVVVGITFKDDHQPTDLRVCGTVTRRDMVWLGSILVDEGLH